MYCEIPTLTRCCFCLPLRYGILTFGYLNLIFSIVVIGKISYMIAQDEDVATEIMAPYHGLILFTHAVVPITLYCIEIIFNILLIIGAHMKKVKLIKIYYYFGIVTTIACCIGLVTLLSIYFRNGVEQLILLFCGLVFQLYLLLMIKSENQKLDNDQQYRFVNHASENPDTLPKLSEELDQENV